MTPTHRDIVFAQSALTYLRTKLRDVDRLDTPARDALDRLEIVVGAQARTLADETLSVLEEAFTKGYDSGLGRGRALGWDDGLKRGREQAQADDPLPRPERASDMQEALEYVRACVENGDSVLEALRSAVYVFTPDPEPVAAQEPTAEPARPETASDPLCLCSGEGACLWCRLKDERAAHAAEVERLRGELRGTNEYNRELFSRVAVAETELAAARAERPMPTDIELATALWEAGHGVKWGTPPPPDAPWMWAPIDFLPEARAAKAALLGVRREGVTPTREAVASAIKAAWAEHQSRATTHDWLDCLTDAVLALFGAEPKGPQDSPVELDTSANPMTEPVSTGVLSTDERSWNYEAPPDSEIGQLHELLPNDGYSPSTEPRLMTYSGQDERELLWTGTLVRPGQKPEDWTRVFGVSVKAWRRAEPKGHQERAPAGLAGMPTAWRERIERLEVSADDTARRIFGRLDALERAVEGLKGGGR